MVDRAWRLSKTKRGPDNGEGKGRFIDAVLNPQSDPPLNIRNPFSRPRLARAHNASVDRSIRRQWARPPMEWSGSFTRAKITFPFHGEGVDTPVRDASQHSPLLLFSETFLRLILACLLLDAWQKSF